MFRMDGISLDAISVTLRFDHCLAGICVFNATRVFSSFKDLADLTTVCLERFWKHLNIFGNVRNIEEVFQSPLDHLKMI